MRALTLRLDDNAHARITRAALRRDISVNNLIRDAISRALFDYDQECPVCHDTYTDDAGVAEHLASGRKGCGPLLAARGVAF